jgi:anti-anti-sigma regulatory factor
MKKDTNNEKASYKIVGNLVRDDEAVEKFIASGKNLSIDFSECTFISVAGLEWLESMLLKAGSGKTSATFVGMSPTLYKVFKVARIESILNACGSPVSTNPMC